ncbi:hypothetical protein CLOM_g6862 [Closterium sp. NIES-68]|nr:hypothetical protein CLOM_g6862 [Closterium sp. NIES-68]GJP61465.1 hypothetical protein CLOP_g18621 [Closterium sp. NIES-67]
MSTNDSQELLSPRFTASDATHGDSISAASPKAESSRLIANGGDVIVPADELEDDFAESASALGRRESAWCEPWLWSVAKVLLLVLLWYTFSMALSLYNKVLIGEKHGRFPAPLLMTTFHFLLQGGIATILLRCCCQSWLPATPISWRDYFLRVVPTAVATALDIGLSNLSLALITLTFYTMCKSSAPVFLLLFAFLFRLESPSFKLLGIMLVISIGVLFTVAGETEFELLGFILVMVAAFVSGLRWVLLQVLLQAVRGMMWPHHVSSAHTSLCTCQCATALSTTLSPPVASPVQPTVSNVRRLRFPTTICHCFHRCQGDKLGLTNPLLTLSYLAPVMALVCAIFSLLREPWSALAASPYFDTWPHALWSFAIMLVGGGLAFCMIMAEFLLVLETSAVTFSVAGTVKEAVTILVSHAVFGDRFTRINLVGILIIMLGVSLFNLYKISRNKARESDGHRVHTLSDAPLPSHPGMPSEHLQLLHHPSSPSSPIPPARPLSPRGTRGDSTHVLLATSMSPRPHAHTRLASPRGPGSPAHAAGSVASDRAGSGTDSSAVPHAGGSDGSTGSQGTGLTTYDAIEMEEITKKDEPAEGGV